MIIYEFLKEIYFKGELTLWESHSITIILTATLATLAAFFMRSLANRLVKEAQKAHCKVEGIITHIVDAVIISDERGIINTFNPAAEKIFGYNAQEVIGHNVKILMPEPYASEHDGYIQSYLTTKIPKILGKNRREVRGLRANGEVFPIDLCTSKMCIDEHLMFIGVIRDITDYKRDEDEMQRLRKTEIQLLENLQKELSVATAIQMNMLPKCYYLFPQHPQIKTYGLMRPAKEIGGDFYDEFTLNNNYIVFAIGDVSGKGIPAALFMMETMTLLRSIITKPKKFATALMKINKLLCKNNDTNMFVTLFIGLLNVATGELHYSNGGHNPPLLAHKNEPFEILNVPRNILLGVHDEAQYEVVEIQLQEGDTLILYTDGVTEAENDKQEFFSLERAINVLNSTYHDSKTLVNTLYNEVVIFADNQVQSDDITIFSLQYDPSMAVYVDNNFFKWSDYLSVGIPEIDEQHKILVSLINRLYEEVIVNNADRDIIEEVLSDLIDYTIVHFSFEEKLYHTLGYSELEAHREYHIDLKDQLLTIQRKAKENESVVNNELLRFLKKWLQHHIAVEDKKAFLNLTISS